MKNYLSESDWEKIEPEIVNEAQNNNLHDYKIPQIIEQSGKQAIIVEATDQEYLEEI